MNISFFTSSPRNIFIGHRDSGGLSAAARAPPADPGYPIMMIMIMTVTGCGLTRSLPVSDHWPHDAAVTVTVTRTVTVHSGQSRCTALARLGRMLHDTFELELQAETRHIPDLNFLRSPSPTRDGHGHGARASLAGWRPGPAAGPAQLRAGGLGPGEAVT